MSETIQEFCDRITGEFFANPPRCNEFRDWLKPRVAGYIAEIKAERDAAIEIIGKLPKTMDGRPIYPGMLMYYNVKSYSHCRVDSVNCDGTVNMHAVGWKDETTNTWKQTASFGYSTRKAAVAAMAEQNQKGNRDEQSN